MAGLEDKITIVCPVRGVTPDEQSFLNKYVFDLEEKGYKVHYPPRDNTQSDPHGMLICEQMREAIKTSKEVHMYWNASSMGSKVDFGMVFMAEKPLKLINRKDVKPTETKSYENVLIALDKKYNIR